MCATNLPLPLPRQRGHRLLQEKWGRVSRENDANTGKAPSVQVTYQAQEIDFADKHYLAECLNSVMKDKDEKDEMEKEIDDEANGNNPRKNDKDDLVHAFFHSFICCFSPVDNHVSD